MRPRDLRMPGVRPRLRWTAVLAMLILVIAVVTATTVVAGVRAAAGEQQAASPGEVDDCMPWQSLQPVTVEAASVEGAEFQVCFDQRNDGNDGRLNVRGTLRDLRCDDDVDARATLAILGVAQHDFSSRPIEREQSGNEDLGDSLVDSLGPRRFSQTRCERDDQGMPFNETVAVGLDSESMATPGQNTALLRVCVTGVGTQGSDREGSQQGQRKCVNQETAAFHIWAGPVGPRGPFDASPVKCGSWVVWRAYIADKGGMVTGAHARDCTDGKVHVTGQVHDLRCDGSSVRVEAGLGGVAEAPEGFTLEEGEPSDDHHATCGYVPVKQDDRTTRQVNEGKPFKFAFDEPGSDNGELKICVVVDQLIDSGGCFLPEEMTGTLSAVVG